MPINIHSFVPNRLQSQKPTGIVQQHSIPTKAERPPLFAFLDLPDKGRDLKTTLMWVAAYGLAGATGVYLALSRAPEDQKILWGSLGGIGGLLCIPVIRWVIKRFA